MLSRVADSLYWMSRYLERAEHTARVLNIQMNLMLEHSADSKRNLDRMLRALGVEADHAEEEATLEHVLIRDTESHSSIVGCIMAARENARQVREQIHSEMWEQLNRMFHAVKVPEHGQIWDTRDFIAAIKDGSHLFQGITDSIMTHGEGWQFIQVGRFLERTLLVSTLVGEHFREFQQSPSATDSNAAEYLEWIALLRSCTAFEAYCKAYTADLQPVRIAEFLVLNPNFPHSVRFAADALETALTKIGEVTSDRRSMRLERIAGRMRATLHFGQIDELMSGGLHAYLDTVRRQCGQVHNALYQTYITYPIESAIGA